MLETSMLKEREARRRTSSWGTSLQNLLSRKGCPFSRSCTQRISFFRVILDAAVSGTGC